MLTRKQGTRRAEEGASAESELPQKPDPLNVAAIVQQSKAHFRARLTRERGRGLKKSRSALWPASPPSPSSLQWPGMGERGNRLPPHS